MLKIFKFSSFTENCQQKTSQELDRNLLHITDKRLAADIYIFI